jgi:uncharacterized membrane protein YadS
MTPAASTHTRTSMNAKSRHGLSAWHVLPVVYALLLAFLVFTPEGVAEPLQSLASWLVIAGVAALAVAAVVKGLERVLDCEAD